MTGAFPDAPLGARPLREVFPRVLVVGEERPTVSVVREAAADSGLAVDAAGSLAGARERLAGGVYDLVVVESRLSDGSGLELLAPPAGLMVPCIVIAGRDDSEAGARALGLGALDFILQPLEQHELSARLAMAAERLGLREAVRRSRAELETAVQDRTRDLREALERVEQLFRETTDLLASALETRDAETHSHSMRVALFSVRLAEALKIGGESLRQIEWGALLHDIGKIAVPEQILRKTGPLSPDERALVARHPEVGYRMVRRVGFLYEAAELVLSHQERMDGSGYPRGLRGEEIPLSARIFAVADTLDAITSDRPYRVARSFDSAREELTAAARTKLDRAVVEAYARIPDEEWVLLRARAERRARVSGIPVELRRI